MAEHTMEKIEGLTKEFAEARSALIAEVSALEIEIRQAKLRRLTAIKERVSDAANAHTALDLAIQESPGLFKKPKSRLLHGIRVGFQKAKGKVEYKDAAFVVALIKKHFTKKKAATLINTTEKPIKDALSKLSGDELKKLGVRLGDDDDKAFIKPADSEIDKMVDALIDGMDAAQAKAAA